MNGSEYVYRRKAYGRKLRLICGIILMIRGRLIMIPLRKNLSLILKEGCS